MIAMTWPQYLRRECTFRGRTVYLSPQQSEILATLMLQRGRFVPMREIVAALWGDDPDGGPLWPESTVRALVVALRRALPGQIASSPRLGYILENVGHGSITADP